MAAPILPVSAAIPAIPAVSSAASSSASGAFGEALSSAIQNVEGDARNASDSIAQFLSGEGGELHTTIMAAQRAALSFDLFLQMRAKVVSAYQEIMRMQV